MQSELKNQTLVAAELARQSGFSETYNALLSIARQIGLAEGRKKPLHEHDNVGSVDLGEPQMP